jgi:hypothetical protein
MLQFVIKVLICAAFAVPPTLLAGGLYIAVAAGIVNAMRLNYGERPRSFQVLNAAVALTVVSYFVLFAALLAWLL